MTESDKKSFPLEKILTVSLGDYLDATGKRFRLEDNDPVPTPLPPNISMPEYRKVDNLYDLVGVHATGYAVEGNKQGAMERFAERVPEGAEVVVDYRISNADNRCYAVGTALVPRKR